MNTLDTKWKQLSDPFSDIGTQPISSALFKTVDHHLETKIYKKLKSSKSAYLAITLSRALPIYLLMRFFPANLTQVVASSAACYTFLNLKDINPPACKVLHAVAMAFFFDFTTTVGRWNQEHFFSNYYSRALIHLGIGAAFFILGSKAEENGRSCINSQ